MPRTNLLRFRTRLALFALLLTLTAVPSFAIGQGDVGKTAGQSYSERAAAWWQWLLQIPAAQSPQTAQGAIDCSLAQDGPVWFLAGAPSGFGPAERACTVPTGKALFFPVLNAIWTNGPGETFTVAEKRVLLDDFLSDNHPGFLADLGLPGVEACGLYVTVDGLPATFFVPTARVQSAPFAVDTLEGRAGLPAGQIDPQAVTDGFWTLLPPLAPGEHEIRFGGRFCEFGTPDDHPFFGPVDVTYHLTVAID